MINVSAPSLPNFRSLPVPILEDGLGGLICCKLGHTNTSLTITIFTIRAIAHTIFYLYAITVLGEEKLQAQKIFIVTTSLVNFTFLIALRELNIIGRFFSLLLGLALIGQLLNRVQYIQKQEESSPPQ